MSSKLELSRQLSQEFLNFVNKGVSPFHVTQEAKNMLLAQNFKEISEQQSWSLEKGGKYFFTRNKSTLVAFTVGKQYNGDNTGFKIVGAHTDSPCLRLAPLSKLQNQEYVQSHVTTYGGGLWHTWFDRDLTLAGRIIYKNEKGDLDQTLFHHPQALLKIPTLAIHLSTPEERKAFTVNSETHLRPIIANEVYDQLSGKDFGDNEKEGVNQKGRHYAGLLDLISQTTKINRENIIDFDLYFADTQPSNFFGLQQEYISSPRLDNLYSSFFALKGITDKEAQQDSSSYINMVCLFDHEECGSDSFQGAHSNLLKQSIDRIFSVLNENVKLPADSIYKVFHNSYLISADMAHAVHPNYTSKHKENYQVKMNQGVVIKTNHNQRYTTDGVSSAFLKQICEKHQVPTQEFVVKNDSGCGSTIGPLITSMTGIKGVDVGIAQLGMHSIRETCGVLDAFYYDRFFAGFFRDFDTLNKELLKY